MSESTQTDARERLEAFIGEWTMTAQPPDGPPWPGEARVSFEWLEGAPLVIQRWEVEMPEAPNGTAVFGCDGMNGTYFQLYTDERDVQRIYAMSLEDGIWKMWRDGEPFNQRFTGHFSEDGNTITGRHENDHSGEWATDFDVTYTRVA